jgi:TolB-like protein/Tfp pilus assembly protein PilF
VRQATVRVAVIGDQSSGVGLSQDPPGRIIIRDGKNLSITPKVFDVLLLLVENSGSLITKEKLLNVIWPDACVEEANVSVNIASLRRVLGQSAGEHQYIETVPKGGYRFVATVGVTAWRPRAELGTERKSNGVGAINGLDALAVLPFHNGSNDPTAEYLSDGLSESIINRLSRLKSLRVVARNTVFRYKNTTLDQATIAAQLHVRLIVSGRILQLGDRVIIRTELVDVSNGCQVWGGQFHRKFSDVLDVQAEISEEICKALEFQLTQEERRRLTKHYTDNGEAYHLYLKGRYHWNKYNQIGLRTAIDYFTQAIEIDPTYAIAYAGLADCYYRMSNVYAATRDAMPKAKAAAMKALDIDPNLSEAHAALGLIRLFYELDWSGAQGEFLRSIEINPNSSIAHQRMGLYFNLLGRFEDAERELEVARQIDPLSPQLYGIFALRFFLAGDYEQALAEVRRTLEMDEDYVPSLYLLGRIYEQLGQLDQAIAVFEKVLAVNDAPTFLAALGHVQAMSGNDGAARRILAQLQEQSQQNYASGYAEAVIHLALRDKNEAFLCLERACDERCEMMTWLKVDPLFDGVRSDLRFSGLLRRVGLDDDLRAWHVSAAS